MKKRITPKLIAVAALLSTSFLVKAPDSQQTYNIPVQDNLLPSVQIKQSQIAETKVPVFQSPSVPVQNQTVTISDIQTTVTPAPNNTAPAGIVGLPEGNKPSNSNVSSNQSLALNCPANMVVNTSNTSGALVNYSMPTISGGCGQCNLPTTLPGFTYIGELNGHRYFRSTFNRRWTEARDSAVNLGGHLATISSEAENNFISGPQAWIGLSDAASEGNFVWVTGEPVTYTNWWPGQPDGGTGENYVFTNFYGSTKWVDYGTNFFLPFVVEFECTVPVPTQTAGLASGSVFPVGVTTNSFTYTDACQNTATCSFTVTVNFSQNTSISCPQNITANATSGSGAVVNYNAPTVIDNCAQCAGPTTLPGFSYIGELNGHRYFLSNFNRNWAAAKDTASRLGAHLATITSETEGNFLSGPQAWIGLTDEAVEGTFKWVTGEPLVYTNWWPDNPNNTGGIEDHVLTNFYGSTKWVDHDGTEAHPFFIEFECSGSPAPVQTSGLPSGAVFPIGVTTNTFRYTDACQNTVTCSFTVTVNNNLPTSITCPPNIQVNATSGSGAVVNYNSPVAVSSCQQQCNLPSSLPGFTYLGEYAGHRYFRSNFTRNWASAKDTAQRLGAHLVTISSEVENNFVSGDGNPAWIGLTDEASEGNFVWVTGEPLSYTNWWPGNPNNTGGIEHHVFMNFYGSTKWVDHDGTEPYPFIIEFECTPLPTQTAGLPSGSVFPIGVTTNTFSYTDGCQTTVTCSFTVTVINNQVTTLNCPANISVNTTNSGAVVNYNLPTISSTCPQCTMPTSLQGFTYMGELNGHKYFRSNFNKRWTEARDTAVILGGHLVTINSEAENNFLSGPEVWIGLSDAVSEGNFVWVTGEPVTYTNWWPGQPDGGTGENYVFTNFYGSNKWVDFGTNFLKPFIVEFECNGVPTPVQTAGLPSGSMFPVGTTTNTFSYTDNCQNIATCSFTVTVNSSAGTTISCPQNIVANATSGAGATVNYSLPVVTNGCSQCAGPTSLPGFTYLGELAGHRYFQSNFTRTWSAARDTANRLGAHLVTISNATENSFVTGNGNLSWIGLTDEASEGNFAWVTGEPLTYTNWWPENPNGGTAENYAAINFYGSSKWVDSDGSIVKPFIIEFECAANPMPTQTGGLPSGSVFPVGVTTNTFSYTDACQNTVTCSFTVTVNNNLPTTITCPQNVVVNATGGSGAVVNYNMPVVTTSCQPCTLPTSLPGFTYIGELNGHRYFRSNFNRNWYAAKDSAIQLGGHLVTISSEAENNFASGNGDPAWIGLTDEAIEGTFVWITGEPLGYTNWWPGNPNNTGGIEHHVYMNFYGSTKWVDHNASDLLPFIVEFECTPVPTQTAGLPSGSLFPVGVTTNSFSYTDACQTTVTCSFTVTVENNLPITMTCPQNIEVTATSGSGATVNYNPPVIATNCPQCSQLGQLPGFTYLGEFGGNKYYRSNFTRRWAEARDTAMRLGAHLVTISSEAENNFLSGPEVWIGLSDTETEGTFKWVTGEPFTYNNWWPGQPDGGTGENFVFMNFYGSTKWVDYGTNFFFPFIIEFECVAPPSPTQTAGLPSGSVFPIGITTNSFTYTDACRNTATCSFTVRVNSNQPTSITCPQNIQVNATSGSGATVNYSLPTVVNGCPQCEGPTSLPGFTYLGELNGHRYFRSNFERTWTQARDSALRLGAHLVTLSSTAENNFVYGNGTLAWIGLTDEASEGNFVWVTGEPLTYTNWYDNNPNGGTAENYVATNFFGTTKWIDSDGALVKAFIIEFECTANPVPAQTAGLPSGSVFPIGTTTNTFSYTDACQTTVTCSFTVTVLNNLPTTITCPQNIQVPATSGQGAVVNYNPPVVSTSCHSCTAPTSLPGFNYLGEYNGNRYFRSTFSKTWQQAKDTAISLGAHLVTISSAGENNFLAGAEAWIGLTDEVTEGTFLWVTGEPLIYTNWWPGNPNGGTLENHVFMNFYGSNMWVDNEGLTPHEFIIEFECAPSATQTAGLPSGSVFPIGTTTNTFTYTDNCQNTVTCSFTVTVSNTLQVKTKKEVTESMVAEKPELVNFSNTVTDKVMKVMAYPNPSGGEFSLLVTSKSDDPISIRILDMTGTVKEVHMINNKTKTVKVGYGLQSGVYFAEVIQGREKQMVKLIKTN